MENFTVVTAPFSDEMYKATLHRPSKGEFDFGDLGPRSSLGFMDLLGVQDFTTVFDSAGTQHALQSVVSQGTTQEAVAKMQTKSEVLNHPTTPNYSSISSASSETVYEEKAASKVNEQDEENQIETTKKQLKPKKTNNQKREKEPRIAFMTKSKVDHLEDGYRWRKYGQKAVKASPFPRNYFRCTSPSCNVKKRVERCANDPSIVVTTYEGRHAHPSPVAPRPRLPGAPLGPINHFGSIQTAEYSHFQRCYYDNQPAEEQGFVNWDIGGDPSLSLGYVDGPFRSVLMNDNGLLQDVVPSSMFEEHF